MGYPIPGQNQFVPEWAAPFQAKINLSQNGLHHIKKRLKTSCFLEVSISFLSPFFASRQSFCTWHGYFEKKADLSCFLWLYRLLKQNSAAPQGSPPPTQQIKIQMQKSWVGWSTNVVIKPSWEGNHSLRLNIAIRADCDHNLCHNEWHNFWKFSERKMSLGQ